MTVVKKDENENKNVIEIDSLIKTFQINEEYESLKERFLKKKIRTVKAIDNISLEIVQGSMVALLGKNGAGKTTLVKMLSGIISPTSGRIQAAGFEPYKKRYEYSYHIGVVLGQKSLLWPNIPVRESLNLYRCIYEVSMKDFNEKLSMFNELFNCKELLDVPVRKLSLGERMKFEIIASLIHNPEILYLDEPTIGLDLLSKQQMYSFLKQINENYKTTIILTTHSVDDVENLCKRVILLDEGKIIYDGDQETLCGYSKIKTVCVKGSVSLDDELKKYLEKQEENTYIFKCNSNQNDIILKIFNNISIGSDITISGTDIEDILLKVYGGELVL